MNGQKKPMDQKDDQDKRPPMRLDKKTILVWLVIIISAIFLSSLFTGKGKKEVLISHGQYEEFLRAELIYKAVVIEKQFHGTLREKGDAEAQDGRIVENVEHFVVILPFVDESVLAEWKKHGVKFTFGKRTPGFGAYFWNMIPWLLIIVFWLFLMRRMQGGGKGGFGGLFSFGKSRARLWTAEDHDTTFNDVAGCEEAKTELMEVIDFLKNPGRYQKLGGKVPKGVLLLGKPGTGKTLLARAVSGEAGVPFFSLSGADFVEMFVGVGASRVRDLFEQGKKNAPSIIFIDEIDAVGRHRGAGLGGGHDEREQTLNALLVEMDGFEPHENVILMAATNRPDVLDTALLRPGRFDRQIVVDAPDVRGREGILKIHTRKTPLDKGVDLEVIAKGTPGMVGADLANMVNEASLLASRKNKKKVGMDDFEEAKDKVMMGIERKSAVISENEKKLTAYHEAGHAVIAQLLPEADPVHKVTIIPRGRALGITSQLPEEEKHTHSQSYIAARLMVLMGGRAAEQLIFKELTTGAANDLEVATELARSEVCEWGWSEKLGPRTLGKRYENIFLPRDIHEQREKDYSEETARKIDEEIQRITQGAEDETKKLLKEHIDQLEALAQKLLKEETVDGKEVNEIIPKVKK
ncbi:ATP-dependent zinc metalloprotease FtsH [Patescibacteria group bacterium AH-259-L05]|nr:ATP-dependent zinc metalloprotease FtsH [Patescibacteria group bacterium AH-259-L05]